MWDWQSFFLPPATFGNQNKDKSVLKDKSNFSVLPALPPSKLMGIFIYIPSFCSVSPPSIVSHCLDWSIFNFLTGRMRGVDLWLLVELSLPLSLSPLFFLCLSFPSSFESFVSLNAASDLNRYTSLSLFGPLIISDIISSHYKVEATGIRTKVVRPVVWLEKNIWV